MNRRSFHKLAASTMGAALTQPLWAGNDFKPVDGNTFRFAIIADTHIIDDAYVGPEGSPEDTESIFHTAERLTSARDLINRLHPAVEQVFLVGDYFHNYPSPDYDYYFKNTTRLDHAKRITDGFLAPCHAGFGNHDYDVPRIPRELSHRLFKAKFQLDPYYAVEHRGWKFIHLNNFLGATWTPGASEFNKGIGSLGETQLLWLEAQLGERKPAFVFIHYPLWIDQPTEFSDFGLHPLLRKHQDTIQLVVSGHWHKWIDFAHTYGPQHYVMAATRYDPDAYMLIEVDTRRGTWQFLNRDLVDWSTHYSRPYRV